MGREVRRVPADWEHPKDERRHFKPLFGSSFSQALSNWEEGAKQWVAGLREDYSQKGEWKPLDDDEKKMTYEEYDGACPRIEDYMPEWPTEQRTHYQMYENVTEGTPISPVMESPEALARWLANNNANAGVGRTASYEAWLRVCQEGYAPTMVMQRGGGHGK